jgi:hypothetical protein
MSATVLVHLSAFLPLFTGGLFQTDVFCCLSAADIVQNFLKHIQKAHFQVVLLGIYLIFSKPF